MKIKLPFSFLLILSTFFISFSQTIIEPGAKVSGKWALKGSPYIIEGEAIVMEGATLTIEPGVSVLFKTGENRGFLDSIDVGFLRVEGKLIAKGKPDQMINFSRKGETGNWGIIYMDHDGSEFKYCKIQYAWHVRSIAHDDNGTAALSFYGCTGKISNCLLINNGWAAINCKAEAKPEISNCVIWNNQYGLENNSGSSPVVTNSIFWFNETTFFLNGGVYPQISYSLIQDKKNTSGFKTGAKMIFNQDPLFTSPEVDDFTLQEKSPARKKGNDKLNLGVN